MKIYNNSNDNTKTNNSELSAVDWASLAAKTDEHNGLYSSYRCRDAWNFLSRTSLDATLKWSHDNISENVVHFTIKCQ